jgi:hypothetical protein
MRRTSIPFPFRATLRWVLATLALSTAVGCAAQPLPTHRSPTALCTDPTLDRRSLMCANDVPTGYNRRY